MRTTHEIVETEPPEQLADIGDRLWLAPERGVLILDLREEIAVELAIGGRPAVAPTAVGELVPVLGWSESRGGANVSADHMWSMDKGLKDTLRDRYECCRLAQNCKRKFAA